MADSYLAKIGLDIDEAALNKVVGTISKELSTAGKISSEFSNDALETARKYNDEIRRLDKLMAKAKNNIKASSSDADKRLWRSVYAQASAEKKAYIGGDEKRGLKSKAEVDAIAKAVAPIRSKLAPVSRGLENLAKGFSKVTTVVSAVSAGFSVATKVISEGVNRISSSLNKFSNYSNQLNPLGAFGNKTIRGYMTRYGMTSSQAMGFANTLDALNMDESDIGNMTPAQRKSFNELQSYWSKLMGTMDADKVKKFSKTMEQYQMIQAKFNMGLQATVMKLITNSPSFERFMGKIEHLMDETLDFLGSDLVQGVFDGLIDFLTTVVSLLDKAMQFISKIPGFGSSVSNTTNNNTTTNNTYTVYGFDSYSQNETARQISYATNSGGYRG